MSHPASDAEPAKVLAGPQLHDDNGDAIGPRQFCVDEGIGTSATDGIVQALATLTPEEIAATLANRVVIEQATGMLMFVYQIDAEAAHELLKWRAQSSNVKLRDLAVHLASDLLKAARVDRANLRAACDSVLMDMRKRASQSSEN